MSAATHMINFTGDDMPGGSKQSKAEPKGAKPKSVEDELEAQSADPKDAGSNDGPLTAQDDPSPAPKAATKQQAAKASKANAASKE